MSSSHQTLAVRAVGVGKFYPRPSPRRIIQYLSPFSIRHQEGDFWALQDVSFDLPRGEVLGVVGQNGSGKSTLMQMVAGLMLPSSGKIEVQGRTAALLELGAGFNPEFTGRENVFLSGMLYGFRREEMEDRYEEVTRFAGIGDHIDHPVKTYSSGMFARLAFAVSIHVDPDILLVDEILSVGDLGFRARCHRRIEEMREIGTSILFVTHDMGTVQTLCDRALLLNHGRAICLDKPEKVTDQYLALLGADKRRDDGAVVSSRTPVKRVDWLEARFYDTQGRETPHPRVGERCRATMKVRFLSPIEFPVFSLQLKTMTGFVVYDQSSLFLEKKQAPIGDGDLVEVIWDFVLNVCPGPFRLGMGIAEEIDGVPRAVAGKESIVFEAVSETRAYGVANLQADVRVLHG